MVLPRVDASSAGAKAGTDSIRRRGPRKDENPESDQVSTDIQLGCLKIDQQLPRQSVVKTYHRREGISLLLNEPFTLLCGDELILEDIPVALEQLPEELVLHFRSRVICHLSPFRAEDLVGCLRISNYERSVFRSQSREAMLTRIAVVLGT